MTVAFILMSFILGLITHRIAVRSLPREIQFRVQNKWHALPSGWSKSMGDNITGFAASIDGQYYWWINRSGKTIIEGPSVSLDCAKIEVEKAATEWLV